MAATRPAILTVIPEVAVFVVSAACAQPDATTRVVAIEPPVHTAGLLARGQPAPHVPMRVKGFVLMCPSSVNPRPTRAVGATTYDAFVSYSHAADGELAPALQMGLQSLGKPWYRLRMSRV